MAVLEGLVVILLTIVLVIRWRRKRLYQLAAKIPGDDGIPLFGILHRFLNLELKDYVMEMLRYCRKDSAISKTWFGPTLAILTEDADCIHTILNSPQTQKKPSYFYDGIYIDQGLLAINGQQYDRHRKVLNKSFTPSMLQQFIPIFKSKSQVCIDKLCEQLNGEDFDVFKYVGACTLEAFISGHYNYDENFYDSQMVHIIESSRSLLMKRMFRPWYNIKLLYRLSPLYRELNRNYTALVTILDDIRSNNRKCPNTEQPDIVLNLLTNPNLDFTDEEIRDEMITFIFGVSHEEIYVNNFHDKKIFSGLRNNCNISRFHFAHACDAQGCAAESHC
jgi:cytochrome P450